MIMDLKNILEYQKIDGELHVLEVKLSRSENKKKCISLSNTAKEAQQKSSVLEDKASEILKDFEETKKVLAQNLKLSEALAKKDVENMTQEELEHDLTFKDKLFSNLSLLDKKITKIAENINTVLAEYNKALKTYNEAKEQYKKFKDAYDKEFSDLEPKMKEVQKKLEELKKSVEPAIMEKYLSMRKDKIFPIFVPLIDNASCGHCRMELSASAVSKLNHEGILPCEHCRCIIYKK
jgi:predicted  nucleic acid-binding Zn-ribbon protein